MRRLILIGLVALSIPTVVLSSLGCNAIAVPPTRPSVVTPPPVVDPPPALPDIQAIRLSLTPSPAEIFAGDGVSLRAVPIRGELVGPATYDWTFGDGTVETTAIGSVGHVYDRAGDYPAAVTVRDRDGKTAEASTTVTVTHRPRAPRPPPPPPPPPDCPSLVVSPSTLPNGTVGTNYSRTITASGGKAPYSFTLAAGSTLPAGLLLATNGVLSGSPTTVEATTVIVYAFDVNGCMGARSYTVTIADRPGQLTATMSCTATSPTAATVACNVSGTYDGAPVPSASVSSVRWDWDDGQTETTTAPLRTHLYTQPGTYTVIGVMTATTSDGVKTATASKTVKVPP